MNEHLFLFTINPVQHFIEQARKTRDLYLGSKILSQIIGSQIAKVKSHKPRFIFPDPDSSHAPNRFLVIIDAENPQLTGDSIKDEILADYKEKAFDSIRDYENALTETFKTQIDQFLSVNWIAVPYKKDDFTQLYAELEENLKGIKNLRLFEQHVQKPGKKCNLCGERNGLFFREGGSSFRENVANDGAIKINGDILAPGEGLCAICFMKRSAGKSETFPSTAGIATMEALRRINEIAGNGANPLSEYQKIFDGDFDEQLLYDENLNKNYLEKQGLSKYIGNLTEIKAKHKKIKDFLKEHKIKLTGYYAAIKLDGDNMGEWLSGKYLIPDKDLEAFNSKMSGILSGYAEKIQQYFNNHNSWGKLVYAGGDDLLAFLNLEHLPEALSDIRKDFPEFSRDIDGVKNNAVSTASCGVVIAHYKTPLSEVLKKVREMEKKAKNLNSRKDACAIAVLKHSGDTNETVFSWSYENADQLRSSFDLIRKIMLLLNEKLISVSFITNLDKEFSLLVKRQVEDGIIESEIRRLIKRSNPSGKKREVAEQKRIDDLTDDLLNFYYSCASHRRLVHFLSFLRIIRFIYREVSNAD